MDLNPITPEEWDRLRPELVPDHWRVFYWLLWETGIRPGEALNLSRDDIHQPPPAWSINVRRLKKRRQHRVDVITLPDALGEHIYGLTSPRARLHPFPYKQRAAHTALVQAAKRAGVRTTIHPHLFRHGFGRRWAQADLGYTALDQQVILKEMLGHESVRTTERYFRPGEQDVAKAWERLRESEGEPPPTTPEPFDLKSILMKAFGLE